MVNDSGLLFIKLSTIIISLLLLVFQVRVAGSISNIVNISGVRSYHQLVENFSEFLENENITEPQHIYEYFNYAMWNGYLSKDKNLEYSVNSFLDGVYTISVEKAIL